MSKRSDDGVETLLESPEEERPHPPTALTRELNRVEETNLAFYEAFHTRDIQKMERVWSRSPHSRCVHPGWEPVVGWTDIRQSWVDIFRTMSAIEFSLEDVHVEVAENTAWMNLVAHAEVVTDDDEFTTSVVATTIFERIEGQWYIMLHHSSHFADEDDDLDEADADEDDLELDTDDLPGTSPPEEDKPN